MYRKQQGFTLVEIAIVLVIIGLLLGGVLKGQELINSAKIKNIANDLNGITAAVYTYQDRYKALPGDDLDATTKARWSAVPTPGGNQNGKIDILAGTAGCAFNSNAATDECVTFWMDLRAAGLIGGDPASAVLPQNAVGGIMGVQNNAGLSTTTSYIAGLVVCTSNLDGKIAGAIDAQFDDGKPNKGNILGFEQAGSVTPGSAQPTAGDTSLLLAYSESDTSKLYTVCKKQ
ncbi:MAG: prepilin-type N-terminal cleavage/methylation domain-containing protein [Sulfurisoma sp.]|nr:prepilin-type N-terminal cleavage/methylation domain-containing protein [Sulfurisoma sp.]